VVKRALAILIACAIVIVPSASAGTGTPLRKLDRLSAFWARSVTDAHGGHPIRELHWLWLSFGSIGTFTEVGKKETSSPALFWEHTCNEYNYSVRVTRHRVRLSPGGSTLVGCFGRDGREDSWLVTFFEADPRWKLRGKRLVLTAPTGRIVMRSNPRRDIRERFQ
jgi:hypothetical protein